MDTSNAYQAPAGEVVVPLPEGPVTDRKDVVGTFSAILRERRKGPLGFDIYVGTERIVGVKTGSGIAATGQNAITAQFGLIGMLIGYFLKKRADRKTAVLRDGRRALSLEELLQTDPRNFALQTANLESMVLKRGGFWDGAAAGRLEIPVAGQPKPMILLFRKKEALLSARQALETVLGSRLQIDPKLKF